MVSNLEDQLKQTTAQLSMAKDSALELEAEVNKVHLTADQANRTAEDMERRLNRRAGELQASEEKCAQLERRIGKMWYNSRGVISKSTLRAMAKLCRVSTHTIVVRAMLQKLLPAAKSRATISPCVLPALLLVMAWHGYYHSLPTCCAILKNYSNTFLISNFLLQEQNEISHF